MLQVKYVSNPTDITKVAKKSEKLTPFGGIITFEGENIFRVMAIFRLALLEEAKDFLQSLPKPAYKKILYNVDRVAGGEALKASLDYQWQEGLHKIDGAIAPYQYSSSL